jgi:hypothetical protein
MFAKSIVDSDAFIDMPMSARLLYYDLGMRADDDGFVNSAKKIMRMIGATNDDMNILIMRKFVIEFENGVVVIKHWRIHNYIQRDRYKPTNYKEQMEQLETDENGSYRKLSAPCIQNVSTLDTQDRLGKDRLVKDTNNSADKPHGFTPPNVQDGRAYRQERGNKVDPENFWDFYQSKNWMIGKNKMKDWKAAVRTWERSESKQGNGRKTKGPRTFFNYEESGTACPKIEDIELHMEDFE